MTFTAAVALFPLLSFLNQNQTHFLFFFLLRSRDLRRRLERRRRGKKKRERESEEGIRVMTKRASLMRAKFEKS